MIKKVYLINNKIENIKNWEKGYDIFLDPPFADNRIYKFFKNAERKKLFKKTYSCNPQREVLEDNFIIY